VQHGDRASALYFIVNAKEDAFDSRPAQFALEDSKIVGEVAGIAAFDSKSEIIAHQ
jgi:hypothetical protein